MNSLRSSSHELNFICWINYRVKPHKHVYIFKVAFKNRSVFLIQVINFFSNITEIIIAYLFSCFNLNIWNFNSCLYNQVSLKDPTLFFCLILVINFEQKIGLNLILCWKHFSDIFFHYWGKFIDKIYLNNIFIFNIYIRAENSYCPGVTSFKTAFVCFYLFWNFIFYSLNKLKIFALV